MLCQELGKVGAFLPSCMDRAFNKSGKTSLEITCFSCLDGFSTGKKADLLVLVCAAKATHKGEL